MEVYEEKDTQNPSVGAQQIVPGPCPPVGCPPTTEVVCIQVDKIYDACSQRRCPTATFTVQIGTEPDPNSIVCRIQNFTYTCTLTQVRTEPPLVRAEVTYSYDVIVSYRDLLTGVQITLLPVTITNTKTVVLFGEAATMFCKVEPTIQCLGCDLVNTTTISCDVGEYIEIKTAAHVQLLIPSYGFCPPPPECQELPTRCEEFLTGPPPRRFPPQPWQV